MIGNIVGSNLFNILAVFAVPGLLAPSILDKEVLTIDLPIMLGFTLLMLLMALPRKGVAVITKPRGLMLVVLFITYLVTLYFRSSGV